MRTLTDDPFKPGVGPLPTIKTYECGKCGAEFKTLGALKCHMWDNDYDYTACWDRPNDEGD